MDELTIGDKIYVSSKRAADITGYAKDYVGQLCREGRVEATLVGRSWYVLESSIRDHRFGSEEQKEEKVATEATDAPSDWKAATYEAEEISLIPEISVETPVGKAPNSVAAEGTGVESMQSVWKEWFEQKRPVAVETVQEAEPKVETRDEAPEEPSAPIQAKEEPKEVLVEEEREVEVPLHRTYPVYEVERSYDIAPKSSPRAHHEVREVERDEEDSVLVGAKGTVLRALLIAVMILAVSVTALSSGLAGGFYSQDSMLAGVLDYLGGTRIMNK